MRMETLLLVEHDECFSRHTSLLSVQLPNDVYSKLCREDGEWREKFLISSKEERAHLRCSVTIHDSLAETSQDKVNNYKEIELITQFFIRDTLCENN